MSNIGRKELSLASNIGELNKKAQIQDKITKWSNPKPLLLSADKVFKKAEDHDMIGDEEMAYVFYMRFFNILQEAKKTAKYQVDKKFYGSFVSMRAQIKAIERAEKLAESLGERYKKLETQTKEKLEKARKAKEALTHKEKQSKTINSSSISMKEIDDLLSGKKPASQSSAEVYKKLQINHTTILSPTENGSTNDDLFGSKTSPVKSDNSPSVDPVYVYELLNAGNTKNNLVIILDTRSKKDFESSHINYSCCINIPADLLKASVHVGSIERKLPRTTWDQWITRGQQEHIVILDKDTRYKDVTPDSKVQCLKDAIYLYDSSCTLKSEPLILDGGFEAWLWHYPSLVTNPMLPKKTQSAPEVKTINLDSLSYPELPVTRKIPEAPLTSTNVPKESPSVKQNNDAGHNLNGPNQFNQFSIHNTQGTMGDRNNVLMNGNIMTNKTMTNDKPQPNRETKPRDLNNMLPQQPQRLNNLPQPGAPVVHQGNVPNQPLPSPNHPPSTLHQPSLPLNQQSFNQPPPSLNQPPPSLNQPPQSLNQPPPSLNQPPPSLNQPSLSFNQPPLPPNQPLPTPSHPQSTLYQPQIPPNHPQPNHIPSISQNVPFVPQSSNQTAQYQPGNVPNHGTHTQPNGMPPTTSYHGNKEVPSRMSNQPQPNSGAPHIMNNQPVQPHKIDHPVPPTPPMTSANPTLTPTIPKPTQNIPPSSSTTPTVPNNPQQPHTLPLKPNPPPPNTTTSTQIPPAPPVTHPSPNQSKPTSAHITPQPSTDKKPPSTPSPSSGIPNVPQTFTSSRTGMTHGLPPGWERLLDRHTGRYYFRDHNTRTTHWNLPQSLAKSMNQSMMGQDSNLTPTKEPEAKKPSLKRSLSSPNLANLDKNTNNTTNNRNNRPSINRKTKPLSESQIANLSPAHGGQGKALTGLRNLGNSCYMNSILQCLISTAPLVKYILNSYYTEDINKTNPLGTGGRIVEELAVLIKAAHAGQYRYVSPSDFKRTIGRFASHFGGHQQQDSQEFLLFLLDQFHEDTNRVIKKAYIEDKSNEGLPDNVAAKLAWDNHKARNQSVIVELLQGQFKSTLTCDVCNKQSVTFDAFMSLTLPIPTNGSCQIEDCIRLFTTREKVSRDNKWYCPRCKQHREAWKKMEIWKLPPILVVHFNRFKRDFDGSWLEKRQTSVNFPLVNFDMSKFVLGPKKSLRYNLYGVSNHFGSMQSGHYTAFCKNIYDKKWYKFDDDLVSNMSESSTKSSAAYILCYTAMEFLKP